MTYRTGHGKSWNRYFQKGKAHGEGRRRIIGYFERGASGLFERVLHGETCHPLTGKRSTATNGIVACCCISSGYMFKAKLSALDCKSFGGYSMSSRLRIHYTTL